VKVYEINICMYICRIVRNLFCHPLIIVGVLGLEYCGVLGGGKNNLGTYKIR
jgi:hypothetical protein